MFYLDVVYVSHTCYKCMFQIFHPSQTYVAFKCFHVASVSCFRDMFRESWGHGPGAGGKGTASRGAADGARGAPRSRGPGVLVLIPALGSRPRGQRE